MRITEINISDEIGSKVGLANNTMKRLGSLVALIGKNGSGKTRVLNLLEQLLFNMTLEDVKNGHLQLLPKKAYEFIGLSKDDISRLQVLNKGIKEFANAEVSNLNFSALVQEVLKEKIVRIDPDNLMNLQTDDKEGVLKFELAIDSNDNKIDVFNSAQLAKSGIVFINSLSSKLIIEEFHARRKNQKLDQVPNHKIFNRLKNIVQKMLGITLSVEDITKDGSNTIEGVIYLNEQPFNYSLLSPGQKVLFSYCIYFFIIDLNPSFNLKDSIIIIDEPERHLHPEAQIQLVEGVHGIVENEGQLWIATHSVHILSYLKPEQIFYLENGRVKSPSSMTPSKALDALLGYSYDKYELASLILSNTDWTFSKFIADCLINPEIISKTDDQDPQYLQFYEYIENKNINNILDYGAGHGRLEKTLEQTNANLSFKIDVFEREKKFSKELNSIRIINSVFTKEDQLKHDYYDLVILSNVLHEIPVKEWLEVIGTIRNSLNDDGALMVLEDLILPKGEAPNENGYLVLGKEELETLFNPYEDLISYEPHNDNHKGRIMCVIIKKRHMFRVSDYHIANSIKQLKERCFKEVKRILHANENDSKFGRYLGFYNQQYLNCEIALEILNFR